MQEEVNEKTISLCIKGGKITAQILKAALIKLLAEMDKKKQQQKGKGQCKRTGKQSIKSLQKSGAQITNIVVTDNNIKSFDRVARKYGIDYSLKKVEQEGKSEYLVFFKAKDVDVMTAAFKEYTSETLKKQKRESVRQKLEKVKEAGCRVQQDGAVGRYEKADPAEFSVHYRLLHGGESRMALPSLQWRFRDGQAHGSLYELWSGLQKCLA